MKTETWRFERSTMTVRDGANHCLFSAKTFASGGTFDAARSADAEKLLALAAAAPDLLAALDGILQWWMESDGGDDMPVDLFDRAQAALKSARGSAKRLTSLSDIKGAVLAGQSRRIWLDDFETLQEAVIAYPDAVVCAGSTYQPPYLNHLPEDGE